VPLLRLVVDEGEIKEDDLARDLFAVSAASTASYLRRFPPRFKPPVLAGVVFPKVHVKTKDVAAVMCVDVIHRPAIASHHHAIHGEERRPNASRKQPRQFGVSQGGADALPGFQQRNTQLFLQHAGN